MKKMKVNILGTEYTISIKTREEDSLLDKCDGYCDKTTKNIVVCKIDKENCELGNPEWYVKKVIRHEIIHAFLFESGLHECSNKSDLAHDDQLVDWFAIQFKKILDVFQEIEVLH